MDRPFKQQFATRSVVMAARGIAATSHPLATQIAVQILRQDGSAVDAAIGANAALGLMEPTGAGVGGDLFAIVWDAKQQRLRGLNASGRSPLSLTLNKLQAMGLEKIPAYGPMSVSVPVDSPGVWVGGRADGSSIFTWRRPSSCPGHPGQSHPYGRAEKGAFGSARAGGSSWPGSWRAWCC